MKHLPFLLVVLTVPSLARATVVSLPTDDELVAKADVIALADVTRVETFLDAKGFIRTFTELSVTRGIRGADAGEFLAVAYPGGTLGGATSRVSGTPELKVGDKIFAYLSLGKNGELHPVGFRYGVLNVTRSADGTLRASRNTEGLTFLGKQGDSVEPRTLDNVRLEELVKDVTVRMQRLRIPSRAVAPNATRVVPK